MDISDTLFNALDVRVEPFAICDVRRDGRLDIDSDASTTIHYTLAGEGRLIIGDGTRIEIGYDDVVLVPRGVKQRIELLGNRRTAGAEVDNARCLQPSEALGWLKSGDGPSELVLACGRFHASYGPDVDIFSLLREPIVESFRDSTQVRSAFEAMLAEFEKPQLGTVALTSALMKQCLILCLRRLHAREDQRIPWLAVVENPRLHNALRVMFESPEKHHRVEDLAELAFMSRSSFSEHFTKIFGQPPHDFLTNYRLRRAAQLLLSSDLAVGVVADKVGYQSRSSFSRAFKQLYGCDPGSYRKATARAS